MSIADSVDFAADFLTVVTTFAVFIQLRYFVRQMRMDAFIRIQEINRELVTVGLTDSEILGFLESGQPVDDPRAKRYAQLWLNQMNLVFRANREGQLHPEFWTGMRADLEEFVRIPLIRHHWKRVRKFYPETFQEFVDSVLDSKISK
jgi:hypothetical protein